MRLMASGISERDFLFQHDWRGQELVRLGARLWFIAHQNFDADYENGGIYCALISTTLVDRALSRPTWDLSKGNGLPGWGEIHKNAK